MRIYEKKFHSLDTLAKKNHVTKIKTFTNFLCQKHFVHFTLYVIRDYFFPIVYFFYRL